MKEDHHKSQNHRLVCDNLRGRRRYFSRHMARNIALVATEGKNKLLSHATHEFLRPCPRRKKKHVENVYLPNSTQAPGRSNKRSYNFKPECQCVHLPKPRFQCLDRACVLMQTRHKTRDSLICRRQMEHNAMRKTWWCTGFSLRRRLANMDEKSAGAQWLK